MKKLLIISYYWPPSAGSGVQRWLKFAKYLPLYGWKPIIYTPENPSFKLTDESLLKDISPKLSVIKRPIWEPYGLANIFGSKKKINTGLVDAKKENGLKTKIMNWARGNLFIPDPRVFWVKPSVKFLKEYIKINNIDYIITTGPPHSMHLIGAALKRQMDLKWIMDIRDPWSKLDFLDSFRISPKNRLKYENMEAECLALADRVIATSPSMFEMLQDFDTNKFRAITNGYDLEDFSDKELKNQSKAFIIYHAGLLNKLRNPSKLWIALDALIAKKKLANNFKLHLVGIIDAYVSYEIKQLEHLAKHTIFEDYKPHNKIIEDYANANILLLLINNTADYKVNIPGKLFEYIASKKPILAIGPKDADANQIIINEEIGLVADYNSEDFEKTILDLINMDASHFDSNKKYSRTNLAKQLSLVLEELNND